MEELIALLLVLSDEESSQDDPQLRDLIREMNERKDLADKLVSTIPLVYTVHQDKCNPFQIKEFQQLEESVAKGFKIYDGPFVKTLDSALASFNVYRQAYYSGTFVGNHVHRTLKVTLIVQ